MWVKSYLCGRQQLVCIGENKSLPRNLDSGVPQGSVLGPVLFTVYTSSLGHLLRSHSMKYHLYADDSSIYIMFKPNDLSSMVQRVEQCTLAVREWMSQKGLKMNDSKTEALLISSKPISKQMDLPCITIGDCGIKPNDAAKMLGVIFDKHITLTEHISSVCKSIQFHLYNIGRIRKHLTQKSAEQLVHALITTKLDYCNALLIGLPSSLMSRLQRLQNVAARIVTCTKTSCHITPVLRELHWLPVQQRVKFKVLLLVFKCVNNMAPRYLTDLIVPYKSTRSLRSSSQNLLNVPFSRNSSYNERAFGAIGPRMWNGLPNDLREISSPEAFKTKLKTFLFIQHFN